MALGDGKAVIFTEAGLQIRGRVFCEFDIQMGPKLDVKAALFWWVISTFSHLTFSQDGEKFRYAEFQNYSQSHPSYDLIKLIINIQLFLKSLAFCNPTNQTRLP